MKCFKRWAFVYKSYLKSGSGVQWNNYSPQASGCFTPRIKMLGEICTYRTVPLTCASFFGPNPTSSDFDLDILSKPVFLSKFHINYVFNSLIYFYFLLFLYISIYFLLSPIFHLVQMKSRALKQRLRQVGTRNVSRLRKPWVPSKQVYIYNVYKYYASSFSLWNSDAIRLLGDLGVHKLTKYTTITAQVFGTLGCTDRIWWK